jgi:hypothetical protein
VARPGPDRIVIIGSDGELTTESLSGDPEFRARKRPFDTGPLGLKELERFEIEVV